MAILILFYGKHVQNEPPDVQNEPSGVQNNLLDIQDDPDAHELKAATGDRWVCMYVCIQVLYNCFSMYHLEVVRKRWVFQICGNPKALLPDAGHGEVNIHDKLDVG